MSKTTSIARHSFMLLYMVIFKLIELQNRPLTWLKQIFIYSGYERIAELLIKRGADINAKNTDNETSLTFAATHGSFEI